MRSFTTQNQSLIVTLFVSCLITLTLSTVTPTEAAINPEINYQGKLTNASNVAVANGTYNMRFWLLTSPSIATTSAIWTESLTTTNKVQVTNGLFSVMLGSTSPLTGVDFNQTLYLGVEVGGTTTPAWDGEMSPRKILGSVPTAFFASTSQNAVTVGGVASTSFLRSDEADTASSLLTFTGGIIANSSSTITNLTTSIATTTILVINNAPFTSLTGTGLTNTAGVLTASLGTDITAGEIANSDHGFFSYSSGVASLDTGGLSSANLSSALTDETGTGSVVFSATPNFTGTIQGAGLALTGSSTLGLASTTAISGTNLTLTGTSVLGYASTTALSVSGNAYLTTGNLGIGSSSPNSRLSIVGTAGATTPLFTIASSTGSTLLTVLANGNVGIGSSTPGSTLSVSGGNFDLKAISTEGTQGAEMISAVEDRDFSTNPNNWTYNTGWTQNGTTNASTTATSASTLTLANIYLSAAPSSGNTYQVSFQVYSKAIGTLEVAFGSVTHAFNFGTIYQGTAQTQTIIIKATGSGALTFTPSATWLGTIDNVSIRQVTPSAIAQTIRNADGSVGVEIRAGGTSKSNTFIGKDAGLYNTTGTQNSFSGTQSGYSNTTGFNNSFLGYSSGQSNTVGSNNSFVGSQSGYSNTNGSYNSFVGSLSGYSNTTGTHNSFFGNQAGNFNSNGSYNSFLGQSSGYANTTGNHNSFLGYYSGYSNTTGSGNLFLGYQSASSQGMGDYNIALGYNVNLASTTASNQLNIGNLLYGTGLGTSTLQATGNISIGTSSPYAKLSIQATPGSQLPLFTIASTTGTYATSSLFTVLSNGNVGIGTSSPSRLLTVAGAGYFGGDLTIAGNTTLSYASTTGLTATNLTLSSLRDSSNSLGTNGMILQTNGSTAQWVATSTLGLGGAGGGSVTSVDMSVPTGFAISGNPITTNGTLALTYSAGYEGLLTASSTNWNTFYDTPSNRITAGNGLSWTGNTLANTISSNWLTLNGALTPSTTLGIRINASSTIGDGTGAGGLTILGNSTTTGNSYFNNTLSLTGSTANIALGSNYLSGDGDDEGIYVDASGDVGIGTTSLMSKLAVFGSGITSSNTSGAGVVRVNRTDGVIGALTAGSSNVSFLYDDTGKFMISPRARSEIEGTSFVANSLGITVDAVGNVGIMTQTPTAPLTVNGNGYFSGLLTSASSSLGTATSTSLQTLTLGVGSDYLTDITGSGLTITNNALTVATSTFFTTSAQFAQWLSDETGTGNVVFSAGPIFTGTPTFANLYMSPTGTSTLGLASTTALSVAGNAYLTTGNLGIGSSSPSSRLSVTGTAGATTPLFTIASSTNATLLTVLSGGNVGIGTSTPNAKLTVQGGGLSAENLILSQSYNSIVSAVVGSSTGYTNFSGGIGTGGSDSIGGAFNNALRLTHTGNLVNIGSIQGGELNLTNGGTFASSTAYTTGSGPRSVSIGDLNGDGKADIVTANSNGISVHLNNGNGTFATKVDYITGTNPNSVASGDMNGDGKADLAATGSGGVVSVFLNNGNGTFATKVDYTTGGTPLGVSIGDLNGDGKADLAVANYSGTALSVFLNNGNGTFAAKSDYSVASSPRSVSIGDVNGDGKADIVAASYGFFGSVSVLINKGNGTFAANVDYSTGGNFAHSVAIGDVNGDGKADLAAVNYGSNSVVVLLNNGNGTMASSTIYTTGSNPDSVAIGDVNGDGKADLAVTGGGVVSVFLNNGNGTFATRVNYTTGIQSYSVSMGDLNGDGKADLAAVNYGANTVSVLINNATPVLYAQASTGNISIGTSSPYAKLSIQATPGSQLPLFTIASTTGTYATSSLFTVLSNGNVGIGSSSPSRLLTIAGAGYFGGDLIIAGNTTLSYASTTGLTATNLTLSSLRDSTNSLGTSGMILQTNGATAQWVATSTLGFGAGGGVTSVDMSVPTGLSISGNPITTSGTLALTLTGGYVIPTTTRLADLDGRVASSSIDTSSELAALLTDETGTGSIVFSATPNFTGTIQGAGLALTGSSTLGLASTTAISGTNLTLSGTSVLGTATSTVLRTTTLGVGSDYLTDITGSGLSITNNALTVATSTFFTTSAQLASWLSDETGSGSVVFSASPTFTGTAGFANIFMSTTGTSTLGYASTTALSVAGNAYLTTGNLGIGSSSPTSRLSITGTAGSVTPLLTIASSTNATLLTVLSGGKVGVGTANPGNQLEVKGSNPFIVANTTGSYGGFRFQINDVDRYTAALNSSGDQIYSRFNSSGVWQNDVLSLLATGGVSLGTSAQTLALTGNINANSGQLYVQQSTGNVGIGTTTPGALLNLDKRSLTGSVVGGMKQYLSYINATESAVYYGDESYFLNAPTATSTFVGKMIRVEDTSVLGNTVRGLEAQAFRGTNTKGENTGLSGFGRTFGVRGTTLGDAGSVYLPAGVFAESQGTTQGNALRAYSGTLTTEDLVSLFHDGSTFSGTGLSMNFGNSGGSFAATSSAKFLDLQVGGTSKFTVTAAGTTTIGDGTTANMAGLQIGFGGLCVDNDGSCTASTTGRITSVSSASGNSDLAEMYFSSDTLETGEIVSLTGGLSVGRASAEETIIGVISTKPGLIMGFDDVSLVTGEGAYPVALKGRVPVKLSTENGPITKGDRIALSSIPGIGMKANDGDTVVGIALEDYTGEYAYSPAYINQFGDDLVKTKAQARSQELDPRTQDGCSYGGGNAQGEAQCVKDTVKPIKPVTVSVDTKTSALNALKAEEAVVAHTADGQEVTIGHAIMFVHLHDFVAQGSRDILAELSATTSVQNGNGTETLWSRVKELAQNFVDGVLTVAQVVAHTFTADRVETKVLCVGETCVDEETLKALLQNDGKVTGQISDDTTDIMTGDGGGGDSGGSSPEPAPITEEPPLESTDSENPDSNGASNQSPEDPSLTTETPVEEPPVEIPSEEPAQEEAPSESQQDPAPAPSEPAV